MKDLAVFTSNYKPTEGNDLTTTAPQETHGMGAGFVSLPPLNHFSHKLWGQHFKCNIPGISFCLWSFISSSPGMAKLGVGFLNAKCLLRPWFFRLVVYSSWVQNQILNSITKWGGHQSLSMLMSVYNKPDRSLVCLNIANFAPIKMAKLEIFWEINIREKLVGMSNDEC